MKWHSYLTLTIILLLGTSGCLSPITLHRAVLAYDDAVTRVGHEQLLLNIVRARHHRAVHFTTVPSVAATFLFQASAGITPPEGETGGLIGPVVNATVAENPTITIVPMEGEEFTQRLLTPMDESRVTALLGFGTDLNMLLRLVCSELRLKEADGVVVLSNKPEKKAEYEEFRRRVLHLASLYQRHQLQIEKLVTQTIWTGQLTGDLGPGDILQALEKDYEWSRNLQDQSFILTRKRIVVSNYFPGPLSSEQKRRLGNIFQTWPPNEILVDIQPGFPGGEYPMQGTIRLRSFDAVLEFLSMDRAATREYAVEKDPRTGWIPFDPPELLKIVEAVARPEQAAVSVHYNGRAYAIPGEEATMERVGWDLRVFRLLYELFQMTVRPVQAPVPGITIAK